MDKTPFSYDDAVPSARSASSFSYEDAVSAEPAKPGMLRGAGDSAIALGSGVTQGVKMLTDVAGAGNAASRALGKATDALTDLASPYTKAKKQARSEIIKQADDSGSTWEQVKAYTGSFADAPLDTTLNAVGTSIPTLAAGLLTGGSAAAGIAARAAQVGIGAAQGVGGIKGQIHESVKQKHLEAGATEADATQRADAAQAYSGPNAGSIALGGALGAVAGGTGAESAVRRLAGQRVAAGAADAAAPGIARSAARGVAHETPMEMLQGGQERYASNTALQGEGFDVPTMQGVVGQAALEGLASAPMGGGFGAIEGVARQGVAQRQGEGAAAFAAGEARTPPDSIKSVAAKAQWVRGWDVARAEASASPAPAPAGDVDVSGVSGAQSPQASGVGSTVDVAQAPGAPADTTPSNWETGTSPLAQQIQSSVQNAQDLAAQAMKPSERMGLNADDGAMSTAAVVAVDSRASEQMQAAQQAADQVQDSREPAAKPAAADPETGEVVPAVRAQELQERLQFIEQQARANGGWDMQLVSARDAARAELAALNPSTAAAQGAGARSAGGSSAAPAPTRPAAPAAGATDPAPGAGAGAGPGLSAGEQIAQLETAAANAQARAADWSSREYKPNSKPLPKYEAVGGPVDVQEANEQRRLKEIAGAKTAASSARAQAETLRQQGNVQAQQAGKAARVSPTAGERGAKAIAQEGAARRAREEAGPIPPSIEVQDAAPAAAASPGASKKGPANVAQATQAKQAKAQQPQAGGTPTARSAAAPGLNNATTTLNNGAQAAAPAGQKAQASGETSDQRAQRGTVADPARRAQLLDASERWTRMTTAERQALAQRAAGLNAVAKRNAHTRAWGDLGEKVRGQLAGAMEPGGPAAAGAIEGKDIDGDWMEFAKGSGTKAVPRAEMPQIKAAHRGAMTNFMNARGIAHQEESVPAGSLKPTQAEFSRKKVAQAKGYTDGDRSILISQDGHVLDGHHQWLAAREQGNDVRVIRLDAPIDQLLQAAREFPSSSTSAGAAPASFRRSGQDDVEAEASASGMTREQAEQLLRIMGQVPEISPAARAQAVAKVRTTVDAIRSAWANGPDVVVAFDMNDPAVPADARAEDLKQRSGGAAGAPEGFYWKGKTYLMASQLSTPNDAARVLFHEALGHHGLRGTFGKDLDNILNQVATMRRADVDAKIKEYGLRGSSAADRRVAAEEVLAEIAQATPNLHFVKRAIAAIRNWLRANVPGFRSLAMRDADIIQAFILPARRYVEQGAQPQDQDGVPALSFSRSAMKSVDANIARGRKAMAKALAERNTVNRAMFRNGLGWVDFVWGSEGVIKPSGRTKGAMGLVHLLEARQRKDGLAMPEVAQLLDKVVQTIASGQEFDRAQVGLSTRVGVEHESTIVWLTRREGSNAWIVTGYEKTPSDTTAGRATAASTHGPASLTRRNMEGAGPIVNEGGDENNPMFSRSKLAEIKDKALDQIHQTLSHPGKVSLWDRSVGTMRNLAERMPTFKPVFEAAQQFIDDVSTLANEAADAAPRLLPRVDSWKDLKKQPISAADNKAVAAPVFEGTLMWGRDVDGTAVLVDSLAKKYANISADEKGQLLLRAGRLDDGVLKNWRAMPVAMYEANINARFESQMLKAGVVWTDNELKDIFKANDHQVSLYREARAGIDKSIDITSRADMLRALGEEYAGLRDVVMAQATLEDAMKVITDVLQQDSRAKPDAGNRISSLNNLVVTRYEQSKKLMDEGYTPLMRFGKYKVYVQGKDGESIYFGMYESQRESNLARLALARDFPGAKITQGTMSQLEYKLFAGITPETLEQFGNMLSLDSEGGKAQDKAFQEYLKLAKNNHSALKRMIHRKGTAGYSQDVGRVLASFVYSNARMAAGGLNAGTLDKAIGQIPQEQGELKDVAMSLRSYIQDPQEEGQAVRGMLFAQYLGGSLASAMVNMTQPFAVTLPWLSQYGGIKKAGGQMARALKDMGTPGFQYEKDLALALRAAEDDGTVSPQEVHQLMAQARGAGGMRSGDGTRKGDALAQAGNVWEKTKVAWGQPFALAEQFNRRTTFIASYRIAKDQGMANPGEFARKAVLETQFLYSKANKMRWARGAVGGTLMTFKTYSVSYLELMHRMWHQGGPEGKRAVAWSMAMLLLMGGAGGLPFMEDAEDLIDGAGQLMGYNFSLKQTRKGFLQEWIGKDLAEFMESGLSGLPGAPIDVSGRLGMGNLIPGTGLALSKQSRERDLLEIAGPAGDLVSRGFAGARKLLTGDVAGAAVEVSPTAVRNALKGADMAASGIYKDTKGYKVIDTTLAEAASKFLGFQPRSVAEVQEANSFMLRSKSFYNQNSSDIKAQWAKALFEKDESGLAQVRERLAAWNRNNPEQPIVVKMPDVWKKVREMGKDRTQRIADTAPKALRAQMRQEVAGLSS